MIASKDLLVIEVGSNHKMILKNRIGVIKKNEQGYSSTIKGMFIEPIYNRLISYSSDGSIRIWDDLDLSYGQHRILMISYHPDCDLLISSICV